MKKKVLSLLLVLVLLVTALAVMTQAEETLPAGGAIMVAHDGEEIVTEDPAEAWTTGQYAYVKLYGQTDAFANMQGDLWVDLNGNNLEVGGTGKLYAFDSANDSYDAAACGTVTKTGEVDIQKEAINPFTECRYVTVAEGNTATFHRIDVSLTHVTLQTEKSGIYYKALYHCDETLEKLVDAYGVVLSVNNMPGADFKDEIANGDKDRNRYTVASEPFRSGVVANSGALVDIMKINRSVEDNNQRSNIKVYANAYIELDGQIVVGDIANAGKTAEDENFDGADYSLQTVMDSVDEYLYTYTKEERQTINTFYTRWKDRGLGASFTEIEKLEEQEIPADINANLAFVPGTTDAYCPVCKEVKTWTKLTANMSTLPAGHVYLADHVTKTADGNFLYMPGSGKTTCLHLNGHNLTAVNGTALYTGGGTLNVMGKGEVSGTSGTAYAGCAVYLNNPSGGRMNLYGGTYVKSGIKSNNAVIACKKGTICIYEGADIKNTSWGEIYMGDASGADSVVILNGVDLSDCQVRYRGNAGSGSNVILEVVDSKLESIIGMTHRDDLVVKGEPVIGSVTMAAGAKITPDQLAPGASIKVIANGVFTKATPYVENAKKYLTSDSAYKNITVRNDVLHCGKDYTSNAPITGGYCPVCEKSVTWTTLTADNAGVLNGHYYLESDLNYTGTSVPMNAPGSGKTACVHLNGHKLTSANTVAIHGSSGVINVLGNGTVAGYNGGSQGAVVQTNNGGSRVNLYAGTYQQMDNTSSDAYTVYYRGHGGTINIYEDAKILGNVSGKAISTSTCTDQDAFLGLYQTRVEGDIVMPETNDAPNCDNFVEIDGATIDGNVYVNGYHRITVIDAPKIKYMDLSEKTQLSLTRMTDGAQIKILADGDFAFAEIKADANAFKEYFTHVNKAAEVTAKETTLNYKVNYEKNLNVIDGVAYCPVCEKDVQWTELVAGDASIAVANGDHYYLKTPQTFDVAATFVSVPSSGTACLHLNGQNLTATKANAIYGSGGTLNVMGKGEVAGYTTRANQGAAVITNNANGTINLYSGTYKKYDGVGSNSAVIGTGSRGNINIYEDAIIDNANGQSIFVGGTAGNKSVIRLYGATVTGGTIEMTAATPGDGNYRVFYAEDATIHATVAVTADTDVTFTGKTVIDQLNVPAGTLIDVAGMEKGSSVNVSATGAFTAQFDGAEDFDRYFTTADEGKWVYSRSGVLYENANPSAIASADDIAALDGKYAGTSVAYGEMHDHTASGGKSDGNQTLTTWVTKMNEIDMDFATIVDHRQSRHMYLPEWDKDRFIGGTEPATTLSAMTADTKTPHYNMIFTDPADLEKTLRDMNFRSITKDPDGYGVYYEYTNFTLANFRKLAETVRANGGIFTLVHPKYNGYIGSEDPMEYFIAEQSYFEISTGSGGNMCYEFNEKAYQTWLDLLALDKRVWASAGSDKHDMPNPRALTTLYAREKTSGEFMGDVYFENMRKGNLAAGSVGIRMSIGDAVMGGSGSFEGKRVVFSVGDMHKSAYFADHTYRVELYDNNGRLFEATFDASKTNYYAWDAEATSKFYRVVVWDDTLNTRIAVGNPIWAD